MKIWDAMGRQNPIILDDEHVVEFGDGNGVIVVTHTDGYVEVRGVGGLPINVEPRSANSIWVSVKTS